MIPFLWFASPTVDLLAVGVVMAAIGLCVRAWAAGSIRKGEELITAGPYAFTRNPLYLGSFLIGIGASLAGGNWLWPTVFLLFFVGAYLPTMLHEARQLGQRFVEEYGPYAAEVPGFFPRMTPYRAEGSADATGFRWSRYRRNREWEASLGVLAAFGLLAAKVMSASAP